MAPSRTSAFARSDILKDFAQSNTSFNRLIGENQGLSRAIARRPCRGLFAGSELHRIGVIGAQDGGSSMSGLKRLGFGPYDRESLDRDHPTANPQCAQTFDL